MAKSGASESHYRARPLALRPRVLVWKFLLVWRYRLGVRTHGSQPWNRGSNPMRYQPSLIARFARSYGWRATLRYLSRSLASQTAGEAPSVAARQRASSEGGPHLAHRTADASYFFLTTSDRSTPPSPCGRVVGVQVVAPESCVGRTLPGAAGSRVALSKSTTPSCAPLVRIHWFRAWRLARRRRSNSTALVEAVGVAPNTITPRACALDEAACGPRSDRPRSATGCRARCRCR